jgi:hypothetical protein
MTEQERRGVMGRLAIFVLVSFLLVISCAPPIPPTPSEAEVSSEKNNSDAGVDVDSDNKDVNVTEVAGADEESQIEKFKKVVKTGKMWDIKFPKVSRYTFSLELEVWKDELVEVQRTSLGYFQLSSLTGRIFVFNGKDQFEISDEKGEKIILTGTIKKNGTFLEGKCTVKGSEKPEENGTFDFQINLSF